MANLAISPYPTKSVMPQPAPLLKLRYYVMVCHYYFSGQKTAQPVMYAAAFAPIWQDLRIASYFEKFVINLNHFPKYNIF